MKLRFYRDPDTGLPHLRRHGVTEDEAEGVLLSPGEDRPGRDGARVAIGQSRSGRYLPEIGFITTKNTKKGSGSRIQGFECPALGPLNPGILESYLFVSLW